jgi:hypothetical protein
MGRKQSGDSDDQTRPRSQPGQRRRPPWGELLGGKPIERQAWILGSRIEYEESCLASQQYSRMLLLKDYYGIVGGDHQYPTGGVGHIDWLPWYELALKIASDLDKSLKTVDAPRRGKTEARWRGSDGRVLLRTVDLIRENRPKQKCSIRWCLEQLRKKSPNLRKMPLRQLETRYYEAKRHFAATKQTRERAQPS